MFAFELIPRAPGHPVHPCKRDCPNRTAACKHTCPRWKVYEHDLTLWRDLHNPREHLYNDVYTAAKESKLRQFYKEKNRHHR